MPVADSLNYAAQAGLAPLRRAEGGSIHDLMRKYADGGDISTPPAPELDVTNPCSDPVHPVIQIVVDPPPIENPTSPTKNSLRERLTKPKKS
jgi:hypothetical protein